MALKRPLFWLSVFFVIGILLQSLSILGGVFGVIMLTLGCFLVRKKLEQNGISWFFIAICLGLGFVYASLAWSQLPMAWPSNRNREYVSLQGSIYGLPKRESGGWRYELTDIVYDHNGDFCDLPGKLRLLVFWEGSPFEGDKEKKMHPQVSPWQPGDVIGCEVRMNILKPGSNFGDPDWALLFQRRGVIASASVAVQGVSLLDSTRGFNQSLMFWQTREYLMEVFRGYEEEWLSSEWVELLAGLSIGCSNELPEVWEDAFRNAGVLHLLIVSGGHFAIVLFMLRKLLLYLPLTLRIDQILTSLIIVWYTLLTGAQDSVIRAALFAFFIILAQAWHRRIDWPSLVMLTLLIQLISNPFSIYEAGMQLSYVSVTGLLLWTPFFEKYLAKLRLPTSLRFILSATLAAQLAVLPLGVQLFNQVSLIAPMSNILCASLMPPLQFLVLALIIVHPMGRVACSGIVFLLELLLKLLVGCASFMAGLPYAVWNIPSPGWSFLCLIYLWLLCCSFLPLSYLSQVRRICISLVCLITLGFYLWHPWSWPMEIFMLDVGQGDAFFIRLTNGKTMLIDGGGAANYQYDVARSVLLPFLRRQGLQHLDYAIISHPHEDHYQGIIQLTNIFSVGKVFGSLSQLDQALPEDLQDWLRRNPAKYEEIAAGDRLLIDPKIMINVVSDSIKGQATNINDASLVMQLQYGLCSIWFTGDAEIPIEKSLLDLAKQDSNLTILKVAHHGSGNANSKDWLEALQPRLAIISVGSHNNYGHPHWQVLQRLQNIDCQILRSDLDGSVKLSSNGYDWHAQTAIKR